MGCVGSATQTAPVRRVRQQIEFFYDEDDPPPPAPALPLDEQLRVDAFNILSSLNAVYAPEKLVPVVCLANYAFPLLLCPFSQEDQAEGITLPICAYSRVENGRFMFIGGVDFMGHSVISHTETIAFMENVVNWCVEYKPQTIRIMMLGWPSNVVSSTKNDFSSYGYIVDEKKEFPASMRGYSIVFLTTAFTPTTEQAQTLIDFVKGGGAIVCFAIPGDGHESYPINHILRVSGLAFHDSLLTPQTRNLKVMQLEDLEKFTLDHMCDHFLELMDAEDVDLVALDDSISQLRYSVSEMTEQHADRCVQLYEKTWSFLERTGFHTDNAICPSVIHAVAAVIVAELVPKLPADRVTASSLAELFPGLAGPSEKPVQSKMRMSAKAESTNCTGMWLQAGTQAKITSDAPITVQIGSHAMCLFITPVPWKRWPSVVSHIDIEAHTETPIASPFGGLVYIQSTVSRMVQISIDGAMRAPMIAYNRKEVWEDTKELDVPWGEIKTQTLLLTMPTQSMREIADPARYCSMIDAAVHNLMSFIGAQLPEPRRIVFDVEIPDADVVVMDAIYMHMKYLPEITNVQQASPAFYELLKHVCFSMIPDAFFDKEMEMTISSAAACYAVGATWPEADPLLYANGGSMQLVLDLWNVCREKGHAPFAAAIQALMTNQQISTPHDAWVFFVTTLSNKSGTPLPQLMDKFSQSGKLAPVSSDRLHAFQLDDHDI